MSPEELGLINVPDARERVTFIRECGDGVDFLDNGDEVALSGVFNVNDLEALYVLLLFQAAARKPLKPRKAN